MDRYWVISLAARQVRRGRRERSSQRRNGENEDETEKTQPRGRDRAERGRVTRGAPGASWWGRGPLAPVATLATRTPAAAGVTPHPAESNHILFSVRPPLAPLLRCELRCLRDLLRASA